MEIQWDKILGKLLGIAFGMVIVKVLFFPWMSWWEVVEALIRFALWL